MEHVIQLKIDIKIDGSKWIEPMERIYEKITQLIIANGGVVMDDGNAPYTEDMTEQYRQLSSSLSKLGLVEYGMGDIVRLVNHL